MMTLQAVDFFTKILDNYKRLAALVLFFFAAMTTYFVRLINYIIAGLPQPPERKP